jgi:hypothetical protein
MKLSENRILATVETESALPITQKISTEIGVSI